MAGLDVVEQDDDVVEAGDHDNCLRASLAPNAMAISSFGDHIRPRNQDLPRAVTAARHADDARVGADLKRLWRRICE